MRPVDTTRVSLLLRLKDRSDALSWEEFHERYGELLYRYSRSRGAKDADAEDIVQEVEMYVFKAMEGFEYDARKGRFRAYLRMAVVHAMGRRASKEARQVPALDPHNFDFLAAQKETTNDARWEQEWRHHRLRWALRTISHEFEEKTLQAFQLHALGGVSAEETATRLGLGKSSVYQAKSRVLKRVRAQLETLSPDADV